MNNQNQSNSLAVISEKYKNCNLLLPASTEIQLNPFYKYTVMEVQADIKENSGDVFKVGSTKQGNSYVDLFSPAKPLLMKLASAAGIQFDPNNTYGEYLTKNCYKAKAYGAMRMPDGTGKTHCDEKVINLDDEEDRFRLEFMDKSLQGINDEKQAQEAAKLFKGKWIDSQNKWGKPCKAYVIDDVDRQKYIDRGVLVNMTLLRKTFAEKAMTGAILRVVRALIGMKGQYTLDELKKPFAIPRVTFSPDYSDPAVRAAMMEQGMSSVSNMFGSSHPMPALTAPNDGITGTIDTFNPEEFEDNAAFASDYQENPAEDFATSEHEEPQGQSYQQSPNTPVNNKNNEALDMSHCVMCGTNISEKVAKFSMDKFKQPLCMNCQKEAL
ncbi:hypothetical protein [Anaerovorax sp. IOR16]|uniref:hypothetical protein n=1 Tax=Anaerovorax sp. IOR16 TaxID=2773458 RepID=UPI0019D13FF5|nr:hypothetical protein [Anaerovorax sp. IOR16]